MKDLQVFSLIITYNGQRYIKRCLDCLKKNIPEANMIIIDNASTDNTVTVIKSEFANTRLITLNKNYGFGKANNLGFEIALKESADFIFLLNQDVYLEDNTIMQMVEIANKNIDYGIISPIHLNGKGNALDHHFTNHIYSFIISDLYLGKLKELYPCSFINAAAWLVSKQCIKKIGGFNPIFFHYGEDDDYIHRVQYHEMKIGVCPYHRIMHDRGFYNALHTSSETSGLYIRSLKLLTNINYSYSNVLFETYRLFLSKIIINLLCLDVKGLIKYMRVSLILLLKVPRIYKNRNESKEHAAFLNHELVNMQSIV